MTPIEFNIAHRQVMQWVVTGTSVSLQPPRELLHGT
jgi:hypothetical protein